MKKLQKVKKVMAVLIAMAMVLGMSLSAFAAPAEGQKHTITITNTDQNVSHFYEAYQIFKGNLNAAEEVLSDITWGNGIDGDAFLAALQGSDKFKVPGDNPATTDVIETEYNPFASCTTARQVAEVLGKAPFVSTAGAAEASGLIDEVANIASQNLGTKAGDFTESATAGTYTLEVTGDGYYFIQDTTTSLQGDTGSDTKSKYLLSVVKSTTIVAKDTGTTPNKTIGETKVSANSAAIGDTVPFTVEVDVPNTKKYVDHFVFHMTDTLPAGLTFFGLTSIQIDGTALPTANYTQTATTGNAAFTVPASAAAAVTTPGGQTIKIVFNDFKKYVEDNNLIGKTITIKYNAVVNDDAVFGKAANENEVYFEYSNDPNHDYDGDDFDDEDPKGETPKSKTKTFSTALSINKVNDSEEPLAGAEFELSGEALNHVLVTGEKYEASGYTAAAGETIETGTYYKLKDGSYTATAPGNGVNETQYDNPSQTYVKVSFRRIVVQQESTKVTAISDANGHLYFEGLKPGTYTLKETAAPDGYNLLVEPITVKIDWTDPDAAGVDAAVVAAGGFSLGEGSNDGWVMTPNGAEFNITIVNNAGATLPSTGGMGTTIFYVLGAVLVAGAGIILVVRSRMKA